MSEAPSCKPSLTILQVRVIKRNDATAHRRYFIMSEGYTYFTMIMYEPRVLEGIHRA